MLSLEAERIDLEYDRNRARPWPERPPRPERPGERSEQEREAERSEHERETTGLGAMACSIRACAQELVVRGSGGVRRTAR